MMKGNANGNSNNANNVEKLMNQDLVEEDFGMVQDWMRNYTSERSSGSYVVSPPQQQLFQNQQQQMQLQQQQEQHYKQQRAQMQQQQQQAPEQPPVNRTDDWRAVSSHFWSGAQP